MVYHDMSTSPGKKQENKPMYISTANTPYLAKRIQVALLWFVVICVVQIPPPIRCCCGKGRATPITASLARAHTIKSAKLSSCTVDFSAERMYDLRTIAMIQVVSVSNICNRYVGCIVKAVDPTVSPYTMSIFFVSNHVDSLVEKSLPRCYNSTHFCPYLTDWRTRLCWFTSTSDELPRLKTRYIKSFISPMWCCL